MGNGLIARLVDQAEGCISDLAPVAAGMGTVSKESIEIFEMIDKNFTRYYEDLSALRYDATDLKRRYDNVKSKVDKRLGALAK